MIYDIQTDTVWASLWGHTVIKILFEKVMKPNKTNSTGPIGNKLFQCHPLFEIRQNYQNFSIHFSSLSNTNSRPVFWRLQSDNSVELLETSILKVRFESGWKRPLTLQICKDRPFCRIKFRPWNFLKLFIMLQWYMNFIIKSL